MTTLKTRVANREVVSREDHRLEAGPTGTHDLVLLPYQVRWVEDESKVSIWEKSRQIGADWCEAFRLVRERMRGERTLDAWYTSADETSAVEFMNYVKTFVREVYGVVLSVIVEQHWDDGIEIKVFSVTLPEINGRAPRITAMSSSPSALRGKRGDVTISELAFHKNADELWAAAVPVTTWGGRLRVLSSHSEESSLFNGLLEQARRVERGEGRKSDLKATIHRTTIDDAIADGLCERINAISGESQTRDEFRDGLQSRCADDDRFEREYCCKPGKEKDSYFPREFTRPVVYPKAPLPTENIEQFIRDVLAHGVDADCLLAGVDVGRRRDRFVLWCYAKRGSMRRTAGILVLDNQPFSTMESGLYKLMDLVTASRATVRRVCIDENGIGMQLAERAVQRYRTRAEAVTFTQTSKVEMFTGAHIAVEDRTCDLPDCPIVLADIAGVRKYSKAGNDRFDADSTDLGHCDRAVAWALALLADDSRASKARFVTVEDRR